MPSSSPSLADGFGQRAIALRASEDDQIIADRGGLTVRSGRDPIGALAALDVKELVPSVPASPTDGLGYTY